MNPKLLTKIFEEQLLIQAAFSSPRQGNEKVSIRPISIKEKILYQVTRVVDHKALHSNLTAEECQKFILEELIPHFKQGFLYTTDADYHLLMNKKGEVNMLTKPASKTPQDLSHNRSKNHLLPEGAPLPFLVELGIMNAQGKVLPEKGDKFRQINRFLEMVADTLVHFDKATPLHVVDFGCGKAYLTFALYHFLRDTKGFSVEMTGLDLKKDVVQSCQAIAEKLGFTTLHFLHQNIQDFNPKTPIDLMVSLHACDTATDFALSQAVRRASRVILAAPCCQHELYSQITSHSLGGLLQYGILKERFASLATDAARAELLEMHGYTTQLLEFIDSTHTPKNILIRAVAENSAEKKAEAKGRYLLLKNALGISPILEKLLAGEKQPLN
jgi:SAM-dependent methyltransferase